MRSRGWNLTTQAQVLNLWISVTALPLLFLGFGIAETVNSEAKTALLVLGGVGLALRFALRIGALRPNENNNSLDARGPFGDAHIPIRDVKCCAIIGSVLGVQAFWALILSVGSAPALWIVADADGRSVKSLMKHGIKVFRSSRLRSEPPASGYWE